MIDPSELWQGSLYQLSLDEMIVLHDMVREQRQSRRDALARIVPKRLYGDGTETYEDFILPQHGEDPGQAAAAKELYWLRAFLNEIEPSNPNSESTLFAVAAVEALAYMRELGIDYRGARKTVVFWSSRRGRYVQIDLDLYQKLVLKGERQVGFQFGKLLRFEPGNPNRDLPRADSPSITPEQKAQAEAWLKKYPWRNGSYQLTRLLSLQLAEPNTPFWHAATVVMNHERFVSDLEETVLDARSRWLLPSEAEDALKDASEVSFAAGLSAAALAKKPLEYDVVALREGKAKRAEASGKASNSKRAARVAAFWGEIEALAYLYPQISEARLVDQAFENAVAQDPDLWRQGKGQKEAYLSEDIRSKEPYKSRYYALFAKTP
jgi:hypothetical protein